MRFLKIWLFLLVVVSANDAFLYTQEAGVQGMSWAQRIARKPSDGIAASVYASGDDVASASVTTPISGVRARSAQTTAGNLFFSSTGVVTSAVLQREFGDKIALLIRQVDSFIIDTTLKALESAKKISKKCEAFLAAYALDAYLRNEYKDLEQRLKKNRNDDVVYRLLRKRLQDIYFTTKDADDSVSMAKLLYKLYTLSRLVTPNKWLKLFPIVNYTHIVRGDRNGRSGQHFLQPGVMPWKDLYSVILNKNNNVLLGQLDNHVVKSYFPYSIAPGKEEDLLYDIVRSPDFAMLDDLIIRYSKKYNIYAAVIQNLYYVITCYPVFNVINTTILRNDKDQVYLGSFASLGPSKVIPQVNIQANKKTLLNIAKNKGRRLRFSNGSDTLHLADGKEGMAFDISNAMKSIFGVTTQSQMFMLLVHKKDYDTASLVRGAAHLDSAEITYALKK